MDLNKTSVSVVIPNYNGSKLLQKNLPKLLKASARKQNRIKEIIVVDDASTDGSVSYLKKEHKDIRLFKHSQNRGFAATVNMGVRMARGNLVVLLNTDVTPSINFLEHSIKHFNDPKVFAVSFHEKGYGPAIGKFTSGFVEHSGGPQRKKASDTFWVSGGSGLFSRKIWLKLKGFDEELYAPYYWEDLDLGYRAVKRGYKLLWEPKSRVIHEHEGTIGNVAKKSRVGKISQRNQLLFIWKNITSPTLTRKHIRGLVKRASLHPGYLIIIYLALKKWKIVRKKRKQEKKASKVSDEAIFEKFN